jgi:sec-independent protein translocase protein TatA
MFAMFGMGPMELLIIGGIAVLLFGSRLPEVARSLGSSYKEFKKGLNEFQSATYDEPSYASKGSGKASYDYDEYDDAATAPRFEPPTIEPPTIEPPTIEQPTIEQPTIEDGSDAAESPSATEDEMATADESTEPKA